MREEREISNTGEMRERGEGKEMGAVKQRNLGI